jgi:hypothetical protein
MHPKRAVVGYTVVVVVALVWLLMPWYESPQCTTIAADDTAALCLQCVGAMCRVCLNDSGLRAYIWHPHFLSPLTRWYRVCSMPLIVVDRLLLLSSSVLGSYRVFVRR